MRALKAIPGRIMQLKLGLVPVIRSLFITSFFVALIKSSLDSYSILNLQTLMPASMRLRVVEEDTNVSSQRGAEMVRMPLDLNKEKEEGRSITGAFDGDTKPTSWPLSFEENQSESMAIKDTGMMSLSLLYEEKQNENKLIVGTEISKSNMEVEELKEDKSKTGGDEVIESPHVTEKEQELYNSVTGNVIPESKILCDFSQRRSDTCVMHGDIRVVGYSSSIIISGALQANTSTENIWKIRPYSRKWEPPVMEQIKELALKASAKPEETPECAVNHTVPAVVFSTGGFLGNFFHDFADVLIPLFITSRQYHGQVQFLVTNLNSRWLNKYQAMLSQLSRYDIINLDRDRRVHCYQKAQVGLISHKEMTIDPSKSPNGYSMNDFREFLRTCFSLKSKSVKIGNKKPRILLMYRKGSRSIANKREVVSMARNLGYRVVLAGPEETKNLPRFARIVNSCDVMMGVHGAGLTNMVFLPANATLIQIIPWGGLKYACRHDFGDPAPYMGIRYLEYEIKEEESSLIERYPRDHPVFTDPASIHRQGWNKLWSVFLNKQKVKLDVMRFKGVLKEALQYLH